MFGFPVNLDLADRRCVVIGALPVRLGKVQALVDGGATDVSVIAQRPAAALDALAGMPAVTVHARRWEPADLDGAFLVIAHDEDADERASLAAASRARGALTNVMDDLDGCDFAQPALVRRGSITIAVGTGGTSPALARRLRERLQREFGSEWEEASRIIGEVRAETLALLPEMAERAERWQMALDLDEAAALVREGRGDELRIRLRTRLLDPAEAAS